MRISFKQRIICCLTAFAFTITAVSPSAWVFAEELSAEGTTSETAVAETALAETTPSETAPAETVDVTASEASDTAETAADTSVIVAEEPAVMPVQTDEVSDDAGVLSGTIGYERYLDIKAADGGITDGLITGTAVTAGEGKEIMAAASFTQSELDAKAVIVAVKELPEINNGEMTALYGIKGGVLSEDAIAVSPEVGFETEVSLSDWEGVALVKILPSEQELSFRGEDDEAVLSVSGMLPDGAEISAQPVETAEIKEKIENDTQTETVPITDVVFAYDISINSAAGEFQPGEGESVDVVLSSPAIAEAAERGGKLTVVHIADDGTVTEVLCEVSDGSVSFAADGFSVYAVVEHTIEGTVSIADTTYKITVEYGDEAGIPAGAYLRAWWADPEEYLPGTAETLGWTEDDEVYYAKFFDLSIMFDGKVIEPQAPVFVTAELLDVEEGAKALRVVHFTDDGAEEVKSNITDDAVISFETSGFSVYGFGSVMHTIASETTDSLEFSVYSFDEAKTDSSFTDIAVPEEGFEAVKTVSFTERPEKLWVKASLAEGAELPKGESIGIYSVYDNAARDVIAEDIAAGGGLCPVASDATGVALIKDTGYRHLDLTVFPDEASVIELDGMMPKESALTADDVTEQYAVTEEGSETTTLAAYDITINAPRGEYQPTEERPISVEITDPRINTDGNIELYHITDNGETEQVTDFTLSKGKISFAAVGFSVYKIVTNVIGQYDSDIFDIIAAHGEEGFDVSFVASERDKTSDPNKGGPYYFNSFNLMTVSGQGGRTGLKSSKQNDETNKLKIYFEPVDSANKRYYIYFKDGETQKYIEMHQGNYGNNGASTTTRTALGFAGETYDKTVFTLEKNPNSDEIRVYTIFDNKNFYWIRNGNKDINAELPVVGFHTTAAQGDNGTVWMKLDTSEYMGDSLELDGKTYGLMNYISGNTACALVAEDPNYHSLVKLVIRKTVDEHGDVHYNNSANIEPVYVDQDKAITMWTFEADTEDKYRLYTMIDDEKKYLKLDGNTLSMVSSGGTSFQVIPGEGDNKGKIQLKSGDKYVSLSVTGTNESPVRSFVATDTPSDASMTWFNFVEDASLQNNDMITYTADRISVSDIQDGQKVIVYTRIWDDVQKKYDMYAIDCNGKLFPVFAYGGKIMWLGDGTGSLEWTFTEYLDAVTKKPNYYYELYNSYSEKYIAPQFKTGKVVSYDKVGINMPGRRDGEYYTDIIAWDKLYYNYASLRPDEARDGLEVCSQMSSLPFYFATLEPLNDNDVLHTINTVDNYEHGITMKMTNFTGSSGGEGGSEQYQFLKKYGNVRGLLSTKLNSDGYPDTIYGDDDHKNLKNLYQNSTQTEVNHLFTESIYNASGYYDFDSCQNFATLLADPTEYTYTDKNNVQHTYKNFTVYKELGTSNSPNRPTLKHGQFLPYNKISTDTSIYTPQTVVANNEYTVFSKYNDPSLGKLDLNDPRYYDPLYSVGSGGPDYYFGMEMTAKFVKTPDGLDDWGHDVIFEFTGDDDFWLYVDGELILDLGGIHSAIQGKVNFSTGDVIFDAPNKENHDEASMVPTTLRAIVEQNMQDRNIAQSEIDAYLDEHFDGNTYTDYSEHTMRIFYMERGAGASNLHMHFNLASVTPGNVVISKDVSDPDGDSNKELDFELVEYPFQIWYQKEEGGEWIQLANLIAPAANNNTGEGNEGGGEGEQPAQDRIFVKYQNSNRQVKFLPTYTISGQTFDNVYFISPAKNAEVSFPDKAIKYKIKECGVNPDIYNAVKINGEAVTSDTASDAVAYYETVGELKNYTSQVVTVEERPDIEFDNMLKPGRLRTLKITKELYDGSGHLLTNAQDDTRFNYRLYVGNGAGELELADRHKYYIADKDGYICKYVGSTDSFVPVVYNGNQLKYADLATLDQSAAGYDKLIDSILFTSSPYGSISNIPATYSVLIPNLPVGIKFMVEERASEIPSGYGLMPNNFLNDGLGGYVCVRQTGTDDSGNEVAEDVTYILNDENIQNVGTVRSSYSPEMVIRNVRGYGLTVDKNWSDLPITTAHGDVYIAVYAKGNLLTDTIRKLESPNISTYYFFSQLQAGCTMDDYVVREVNFTSTETVQYDSNNTVTNYDSTKMTVTPILADPNDPTANKVDIDATDLEGHSTSQTYVVTYSPGELENNTSRTDTINNTRNGGISIRLFKWQSNDPLDGGTFKLTCDGTKIGEYTTGKDGIVTVIYGFERNKIYELKQTASKKGYVGLLKKVCFKIDDNDVLTLYDEDGNEWGTKDLTSFDPDGDEYKFYSNAEKWANGKAGADGITAFVDVYNKPFIFKIEKTNTSGEMMLEGAVFALYKQTNTPIGGLVKNQYPIDNFEAMTTNSDGIIVISGENGEGRVLDPGPEGSVYFLTEVSPPPNYEEIHEDIIFRVSALGRPSIVSDNYHGRIVETDNEYIYTLSVPNEKKSGTNNILTIKKTVSGNMGNKAKEFTFSVKITNPDANGYEWYINNIKQSTNYKSEDEFLMCHGDIVKIVMPSGTKATITEEKGLTDPYRTTFKVGTGDEEVVSSKEITLSDDMMVTVNNSLNGIVPTGVKTDLVQVTVMTVSLLSGLVFLVRRRRILDDIEEDE